MRAATFVVGVCLSSLAWAQNGTWGGYVTGWQPDANAQNRRTQVRPGPYVWPVVPQVYVNDQSAQLEAQRAQAEAIAAQTRALEEERRRLEAERRAAQLERELLVMERRAEAQRADEPVIVAPVALPTPLPSVAPMPPEPVKPELPTTKGPAIHKWVDDDGVIHYSTKPRKPVLKTAR